MGAWKLTGSIVCRDCFCQVAWSVLATENQYAMKQQSWTANTSRPSQVRGLIGGDRDTGITLGNVITTYVEKDACRFLGTSLSPESKPLWGRDPFGSCQCSRFCMIEGYKKEGILAWREWRPLINVWIMRARQKMRRINEERGWRSIRIALQYVLSKTSSHGCFASKGPVYCILGPEWQILKVRLA